MIEGGVCGVAGCTNPGHVCSFCVRLKYPGQIMPDECHHCCITGRCYFEPAEVLKK